jgi:hypothetical protein
MDYLRHTLPMFKGKAGTEYQQAAFWDKLYSKTNEKHYEWGCRPNDLQVYNYRPEGRRYGMSMTATIHQTIPEGLPSLIIGAGSSQIGEMIYQNGFQPVVQTDFSQVVVDQRKKESLQEYPEMFWDYADARESLAPLLAHLNQTKPSAAKGADERTKTTGEDEEEEEVLFGSVIDKGLIDALYLANDNSLADISKIVSNVVEVLDPDWGVFLTLSRSHPEYLAPYLKNAGFLSMEARRLESPDIYLYRLCKGEHSLVYY